MSGTAHQAHPGDDIAEAHGPAAQGAIDGSGGSGSVQASPESQNA